MKVAFDRSDRSEHPTLNPYLLRPTEVEPGTRVGYKVIAVAWEGTNCWCAYRGATNETDDTVAREGDAISEAAACALFPVMANSGRVYDNP